MSDLARRKILERRARFVAAALAGLTGCGQSSSDAPTGVGVDADASTDARSDAIAPEVCLSPPAPPPVGGPCSSDSDCNPSSFGENQCSLGAFGLNPILPTPVCIDTVSCGLDTSTIETCGSGTGVCAGSVCWPKCTFGVDGAAPAGCLGKNACAAIGKNIGFCFAACAVDADCPTGSGCQPESGWCVERPVSFTKALGEPCTAADDSVTCHCVVGPDEDAGGYCTTICRAGMTACPTGFTCDVRLPAAEYPRVPLGLLGHCAKNCTSDTDCPAGTCVERVCAVGLALKN